MADPSVLCNVGSTVRRVLVSLQTWATPFPLISCLSSHFSLVLAVPSRVLIFILSPGGTRFSRTTTISKANQGTASHMSATSTVDTRPGHSYILLFAVFPSKGPHNLCSPFLFLSIIFLLKINWDPHSISWVFKYSTVNVMQAKTNGTSDLHN